jgi:hypothetical protein
MTSQLDDRIRTLMQRVVDEAPLPPQAPQQAPFLPPRPARRLPSWAIAVGAAVLVLLLIGSVALLAGDRGDVVDQPLPTVITSSPVVPAGSVLLEWSQEMVYDGALSPVAFSKGFAALREEQWGGGGEVWVSDDGIEWAPAASQPPGGASSLTTDGSLLFAVGAGIWVSEEGLVWSEALSAAELSRQRSRSERAFAFAAGDQGSVLFGVDAGGKLAGWIYDGGGLVASDVGTIADYPVAEINAVHVEPLSDGFIFYVHDQDLDTMVSFSADGRRWSDLTPPAIGSPLAVFDNHVLGVASHDGSNLVQVIGGLFATIDGLAWDPIAFDGVPRLISDLAAGDLGWFVFEGPAVRRLWHSADWVSWSEINAGPLSESPDEETRVGVAGFTMIVGTEDLLVYVVRGELGGFGYVGDPVTEVWRATVTDS